MTRPRINVKLQPLDRIIEMIGFLALILVIILPVYYYDQLPEEIPHHFGADGKPDRYGSKNMIWGIPMISFLLFFGLYFLNRFPHILNYNRKVTEQNALSLYTFATRMNRYLNTFITCFLAYIMFTLIQNALGKNYGLGYVALPLFLIGIFSIIGYFFYKSSKV